MWKGDICCWRVTHNVHVFVLERDTCVLIVLSQGTRNSFWLEFIKRSYLNEAVATDLRYSLGICVNKLTKSVWTTNVFGHTPNTATPKKQQEPSLNSLSPLPFTSVCRSSKV
jgi:hypothetical protein